MHTLGPWAIVYRPTGTGNRQWRVFDKDYNPIAFSDVGPHAFNEANARLIAAAPELLKLLEQAEAIISSSPLPRLGRFWLPNFLAGARYTIAEAKGE